VGKSPHLRAISGAPSAGWSPATAPAVEIHVLRNPLADSRLGEDEHRVVGMLLNLLAQLADVDTKALRGLVCADLRPCAVARANCLCASTARDWDVSALIRRA